MKRARKSLEIVSEKLLYALSGVDGPYVRGIYQGNWNLRTQIPTVLWLRDDSASWWTAAKKRWMSLNLIDCNASARATRKEIFQSYHKQNKLHDDLLLLRQQMTLLVSYNLRIKISMTRTACSFGL